MEAREALIYLLSLDKENSIYNGDNILIDNKEYNHKDVRLNVTLHISEMVYISIYNSRLVNDKVYAHPFGAYYTSLLEEKGNIINLDINKKEFLKKMHEILKYAPTEELIKISKYDNEWKNKHNNINIEDKVMFINNNKDNYKEITKDFIDIFDN